MQRNTEIKRARASKASVLTATIIGLLALIALPSSASAFQLKTTHEGEYIRWNKTDVQVVLDASLAELGPVDAVEATIIAAFDQWVDTADLPLEFHFVNGSCGEPGYRPEGQNESCVMASTGYFDDNADAGATTLLSHEAASGVVKDADIVVNATAGLWSVGEQDGTFDLREALLHEVGHFLGLGHSDVEDARMDALMHAGAPSNTEDLHADDIAGASTLYEGLDAYDGLRCSVATIGTDTPAAWLVILLLGAIVIARRKN